MSTPNVVLILNYSLTKDNYLSSTSRNNKYKTERDFYSCKQTYNYVTYVNDGSKEKLDYVDYSGNHEKSSGVFNEHGLLCQGDIKTLKEKMANTKSVIWHGVISFEESFGNKFCCSTEQTIDLMKRKFPRFFKSIGLKTDNVEWFAGLHENTDNKHIHFSFFEKEPMIISSHHTEPQFRFGKIQQRLLDRFKVDIELGLTDLSNCLAISQRELIKTTKERIIDPKIKINGELKQMIEELKESIPKTGSLSFDSENMLFLKPKIQRIIDLILVKDDEIHKKYQKYLKNLNEKELNIKEICDFNNLDFEKYSLTRRYNNDLNRRLGNVILKSLQMIAIRQARYDKKSKWRIIQKRIDKQKRKALLDETLYLSRAVAEEAIRAFDEHMATLDRIEYKRLVEEGFIEQ